MGIVLVCRQPFQQWNTNCNDGQHENNIDHKPPHLWELLPVIGDFVLGVTGHPINQMA